MENMEELTGLLIEFYERFSSWEQGVVRETGLTLPQMHTLEIIGATGELRMKELAGKMGVTTGSLTVLVDRLVRAGLVVRKPDEKDRRSIRVGLTPEGRKHFEGHHLLHLQLSQDIAGALTPEEAERFPQMLTKIMAQF
ncbi:MarR family winged helix-turn-helix transcriptional regulator [Desulfolutivibrio sp.]|uniref:MarR family winged helix-turn-helix transcriptional regulator n=1 Tax=Desulfolutivibrio sp. TaxID=2773296 RepID=UPI002F96B520